MLWTRGLESTVAGRVRQQRYAIQGRPVKGRKAQVILLSTEAG